MQSRVLAILVAVVLALVATAALVVYVNGADRRAVSGQEPRMVWVAAEGIKAGTSGQTARNTGQIKQVPVPNKNVVAGAVLSMPQIENRYAAVDIVAGEQLLQRKDQHRHEEQRRDQLQDALGEEGEHRVLSLPVFGEGGRRRRPGGV